MHAYLVNMEAAASSSRDELPLLMLLSYLCRDLLPLLLLLLLLLLGVPAVAAGGCRPKQARR
jgi:hypothetical protein